VDATRDQPILLGGETIGVRVEMDVALARPLPLDRFGFAASGFLRQMSLQPDEREATQAAPVSIHSGRTQATIAGKSVSSLPGMVGSSVWLDPARPGEVLPAGSYHVTQNFWLEGLRGDDLGALPCRVDEGLTPERVLSLAAVDDQPVRAFLSAQFSLGDRRGYRNFDLQSQPLNFHYAHARWMRALPTLALESCIARKLRREQAQGAAAVATATRQYVSGDPDLAADANPLYQAICAHDFDTLRTLLAAGPLRYNISGKLFECGGIEDDSELFRLALPAVHARVEERDGYCSLVRSVHARRDLAQMQILIDLKLPLLCDDPAIWRDGLNPIPPKDTAQYVTYDRSGQQVRPPLSQERSDTVPWLRLLAAQGVAVCAPDPWGAICCRTSSTTILPKCCWPCWSWAAIPRRRARQMRKIHRTTLPGIPRNCAGACAGRQNSGTPRPQQSTPSWSAPSIV
jgi:hypothetical protein